MHIRCKLNQSTAKWWPQVLIICLAHVGNRRWLKEQRHTFLMMWGLSAAPRPVYSGLQRQHHQLATQKNWGTGQQDYLYVAYLLGLNGDASNKQKWFIVTHKNGCKKSEMTTTIIIPNIFFDDYLHIRYFDNWSICTSHHAWKKTPNISGISNDLEWDHIYNCITLV